MPVGPYPDFATCVAAQKRRDPSLDDEAARGICGSIEQDNPPKGPEAATHTVGRMAPTAPMSINGAPLPTENVVGVELFDSGKWNGEKYTDAQIDDLVANTNELIGAGLLAPPVKVGHADNQAFLEREGYPAAGWVTSVYRVGTKVLGDVVRVPQKIALLVKSGAYRKVSAEVWRDFGKASNGKTYKHVLKAIAILGEEIPAVETLDDIIGTYTRRAAAFTFATDRPADSVVTTTIARFADDADTDAIAETLSDQFERLASSIKDTTKGKIGAPRMRAFLSETQRALRALMGGAAKTNAGGHEERHALTHSDHVRGGEPPWSEVDKTELPRIAFAEQGEADQKTTWRFAHHWVSGEELSLHAGGLRAALAAASGDVPQDTLAHLNAHAAAIGIGDGAHEHKKGAEMEAKIIAKALGLKEDASEQDILAAVATTTERANKFADAEKEVQTFKEKEADAAATSTVSKAITDKKVAPAQKEWATKFAKKDPEGFKEYLAATPAIFKAEKGSDKDAPADDTDARATLNRLATEKAKESGGSLNYAEALRVVRTENPDLARLAAQVTN